jgi:hypothetical protein
VIRTALAVWWIPVKGYDDLRIYRCEAANRSVDVVNLKPEQQAIARRGVSRITDWTVMMINVPFVQLQNKLAIGLETLVIRSTMGTRAIQNLLIPAAACFDITYANQWLWAHRRISLGTSWPTRTDRTASTSHFAMRSAL